MGKKLSNFQWSVLLTLILFSISLLLLSPTLNSDDDFFFLYTLSGGHGNNPTNNLHYIYALHPIITWPISTLFKIYPGLNWYTLFMLALHFISCVNLLLSLLSLFTWKRCIILFPVFFIFIESHLLLSLNYSNTSLIIGISGLVSLLTYFIRKSNFKSDKNKILVIAIVMILISGLLRIHIIGLCSILITWAAFFILPFYLFKEFLKPLILIVFLLGVLVYFQKSYYQNQIQDWNNEESIRQSLFYSYNKPNKTYIKQAESIADIKASLITSLFLYDSAFISNQDILQHSKSVVRIRNGKEKEDIQALYWTFINNRVYLLLAFTICLFFFITGDFSVLKKWALISLGCILLFFYLFIFYKITEAIFLALFNIVIFSAMLLQRETIVKVRSSLLTYYTLMFCSCFWMIIILKKENFENIQKIQLVRCAIKELNNNSDKLFVSLGNIFPYGNYYIWDTPHSYPITNLIYKELVLTKSYKDILRHYDVNNLVDAIPKNEKVVLIGNTDLHQLYEYYLLIKGWNIYKGKLNEFKCLDAYQMHLATLHLNNN